MALINYTCRKNVLNVSSKNKSYLFEKKVIINVTGTNFHAISLLFLIFSLWSHFMQSFSFPCTGNVTQCDSVVSACRNTYASLPANAPLAQQCSWVFSYWKILIFFPKTVYYITIMWRNDGILGAKWVIYPSNYCADYKNMF